MGKSKLTKEFIVDAACLLAEGHYVKTVCGLLGVSTAAWYNWVAEAQSLEESGREPVTEHETLLLLFLDTATRAGFEAQRHAVTVWRTHFSGDYRAVRDFLERRFPEDWGKAETRPIKKDTDTPGLLKNLFDRLKESFTHKQDG